jgi:hypothetical protein
MDDGNRTLRELATGEEFRFAQDEKDVCVECRRTALDFPGRKGRMRHISPCEHHDGREEETPKLSSRRVRRADSASKPRADLLDALQEDARLVAVIRSACGSTVGRTVDALRVEAFTTRNSSTSAPLD